MGEGKPEVTLGAHRRVLVVDDNPHIRELVRLVLEVDHFVVATASDGITAVAEAVAGGADVIVLDEQMPNRSGSEAAALIRSVLPGVRIVAFSAVMDDKPEWADAFCPKTEIADIGLIVDRLIDLT